MLKLMEIKSNEPKLRQTQISNQLGFSDSTVKRYSDDINMNSPYERGDYKKRSAKQKTSTSTKENSTCITNKKIKKYVMKRGDPSNIQLTGKKLS